VLLTSAGGGSGNVLDGLTAPILAPTSSGSFDAAAVASVAGHDLIHDGFQYLICELQLYAFLDLGIEVHQAVSPYGGGFYFQLECVNLHASTGFYFQLECVNLHASTEKTKRSSHTGNTIPLTSGHSIGNPPTISNSTNNMILKLPDATFRLVCQGGHFEQLISKYKNKNSNTSKSSMPTMSANSIIACGIRVSLTQLHDLVHTAIEKNATESNRIMSMIPRNVTMLSSIPDVLVMTPQQYSNISVLNNMKVSSSSSKSSGVMDMNSLLTSDSSNSVLSSITSITNFSKLIACLRLGDICTSDTIHQLHGVGVTASSTKFVYPSMCSSNCDTEDISRGILSMCTAYGVPIVVTMAPSNDSNISQPSFAIAPSEPLVKVCV
jgi:hypothetical protein